MHSSPTTKTPVSHGSPLLSAIIIIMGFPLFLVFPPSYISETRGDHKKWISDSDYTKKRS